MELSQQIRCFPLGRRKAAADTKNNDGDEETELALGADESGGLANMAEAVREASERGAGGIEEKKKTRSGRRGYDNK